MKIIGLSTLIFGTAAACFGQSWEVGVSGAARFLPGHSITSPAGSATAGFEPGYGFSAFLGQRINRLISGEVRYAFARSNARLKSGGATATFAGQSHAIHYDVLFHIGPKESRATYFAVAGGGMKILRGTGKESAYQPLSQFAYLTKTQEVKPMASIGGGVKFAMTKRMFLRAEVRDYVTPFPKELIAPAPGAKFGGLLHDIVPMFGISYEY